MLENESKKFNLRYITSGKVKTPRLKNERLGFCRNIYVEEIRRTYKIKKQNYSVVIDLDEVNNSLACKSIKDCPNSKVWDACFVNQTFE